jgi:hypothetical protein
MSGIVLPPPTPDTVVCAKFYDGLSHGYWKNHTSDWDGYSSGQSFESIFGIDASWTTPGKKGETYDDVSLLQALSIQGGGANAFIREAVAALLNASEKDSLVDDAMYFYSAAEIVEIVQTVYGLNDSISSNDNIYNAELGARYQALFEQWNTIQDAEGYTEYGYPSETGGGYCVKILNFDSGLGYIQVDGSGLEYFIYNNFVIQQGEVSEAGPGYTPASGENVLTVVDNPPYGNSFMIAPGDWSNFSFVGAFFSSATDDNQITVTAFNDFDQVIGQLTFEVDASGPDGARHVDFSQLSGFDDIHNLKIAGTAGFIVDDFRYV